MNNRRFFGGGFGLCVGIVVGVAISGALFRYVVKMADVQPSPRQTMTETMDDDNGRANENAAAGQVGSFTQGLDSYHSDVKEYPHTLKPLSASAITGWHGPYTRGFAKDPWGHDWLYVSPGKHNPDSYDIWSAGPDGVDGTADDIGNWESK